jgi:hypothetical protein
MKDPLKTYWVYARVTAPRYTRCTSDSYETLSRNKTIMMDTTLRKNVTKTVSLWEIVTGFIFSAD